MVSQFGHDVEQQLPDVLYLDVSFRQVIHGHLIQVVVETHHVVIDVLRQFTNMLEVTEYHHTEDRTPQGATIDVLHVYETVWESVSDVIETADQHVRKRCALLLR
ncbi:hypothetical protein D3C72_1159540 [compost metagenome]